MSDSKTGVQGFEFLFEVGFELVPLCFELEKGQGQLGVEKERRPKPTVGVNSPFSTENISGCR